MVYKTILNDEGIFYIAPVYKLLFSKQYLDLPKDLVSIEKETFLNTFRLSYYNMSDKNSVSVVRALEQQITPGKS